MLSYAPLRTPQPPTPTTTLNMNTTQKQWSPSPFSWNVILVPFFQPAFTAISRISLLLPPPACAVMSHTHAHAVRAIQLVHSLQGPGPHQASRQAVCQHAHARAKRCWCALTLAVRTPGPLTSIVCAAGRDMHASGRWAVRALQPCTLAGGHIGTTESQQTQQAGTSTSQQPPVGGVGPQRVLLEKVSSRAPLHNHKHVEYPPSPTCRLIFIFLVHPVYSSSRDTWL